MEVLALRVAEGPRDAPMALSLTSQTIKRTTRLYLANAPGPATILRKELDPGRFERRYHTCPHVFRGQPASTRLTLSTTTPTAVAKFV